MFICEEHREKFERDTGCPYCREQKLEAENAKLRELIGLHREQQLEKDVTSADRRLWNSALEVRDA